MKEKWARSEADRYFERNRETMHGFSQENDVVIRLLDLYGIKPTHAAEIGCSNGYRLSFLHGRYKTNVTGIEPSAKAVADGKKSYPFARFINSTCEDMKLDEKFDLVIMHFVLHWVERENLFSCLEKIDRLVAENGYLILGDFGTDSFLKTRYTHVTDQDLYTFKMPYWDLFSGSGNYLEIARLRFMNDTGELTPDIDNSNMGTIALLRKRTGGLFSLHNTESR